MTISKKFLGFGSILLLFLFVSVGVVSAQEFRTGDNIITSKDEIVDQTLYAFGTNIDISSEVNGDVICAGQNINISGKISGDVICAGQTINISGQVDGDIRLASQTVTVSGNVDGNASVMSQTFTLQSNGSIDGDISGAAEDVIINGPVGRDIASASTKLVIASTVGRDIKGTVENLTLSSNAVVGGSIEYTSKNEIVQSSGAVVAGEVTRTQPKNKNTGSVVSSSAAFGWFIYLLLAMLFTSLAVALLFPSVLQSTTDRIMKSPWKALLVGLVASLAIPVLLIVLGITIIGLPLMILLGLIWLVIIFLSGPFTGFYVGRLLLPSKQNTLLIMLAGSTVLLVFYAVPLLGLFTILGAYWLGTGMIILELMRRTPKPAYSIANTDDSTVELDNTKSKTNLSNSVKKTTKKTTKTK